jgi:hypothetical protein
VFVWRENELTIFNLGTQKTWRTKAEMGAVESAVQAMVAVAERQEIARVGLPRIGAGLGGLRWDAVRAKLVEIGSKTSVELVVFEEFIPSGKARSGRRAREIGAHPAVRDRDGVFNLVVSLTGR